MMTPTTPSALEQITGIIGTPEIGDQVVVHLEDHTDRHEAALLATIAGTDSDQLHVTVDVNGYADYNNVPGIDPGTEWTVDLSRAPENVSQTVYTVGKFHTVSAEKQAREQMTTA